MSNNERSVVSPKIDLVEEKQQPKYDYQVPENGSGSVTVQEKDSEQREFESLKNLCIR